MPHLLIEELVCVEWCHLCRDICLSPYIGACIPYMHSHTSHAALGDSDCRWSWGCWSADLKLGGFLGLFRWALCNSQSLKVEGRGRERTREAAWEAVGACCCLWGWKEGTREATQVTCRKLGKARELVLPEACKRNTAVLTPASDNKVSYRAVNNKFVFLSKFAIIW